MSASQPNADGVYGNQQLASGNNEFNALSFMVQQMLGRVNAATLVKIVAVHAGAQSVVGFVDVQPLVNQLDGADQANPHGTVYGLPFIRMQSGANAVILDPQKDDVGLCVFCDRDISAVKTANGQANPGSRRRFDFADGVYVGGWVRKAAPQRYLKITDDGITLHSDKELTEEADSIMQTASSITAEADIYEVTVPEFTIHGNLHVDGIVHCEWQGTKIGVGYGGTGADLSQTGGADHVVAQLTKGGPFTVVPMSSIHYDLTYSNESPTPSALGGIPAGSVFTEQTMAQMWDALLYPYQYPSFGSFAITGQSLTLEVGDSTLADPTFTWTDSNHDNIAENSISILDVTASVVVVSEHANDGSAATTYAAIQKLVTGTQVYRINGVNTKDGEFSKDLTLSWKWKRYYGESSAATLDADGIKALRVGELSSSFAGVYPFASGSGEYKYLCYPVELGLATSFKDQGTNLDVPFEAPYTVSVVNAFSVATNYRVHRSTNQIGAAINIVVS